MLRVETVDQGHLNSSVLVLNRYYLAVHVVNVRRAFVLLYRDRAEVIDIENGQYANYDFSSWLELSELRHLEDAQLERRQPPGFDWIRTVRTSIQVPRVIRLTRFDQFPRQTLRFNRRNLFARDGHCCQYCGRSFPNSQLSIDHVMPRSRGGETSWENVVCACVECNTKKGGRTPQEAKMRLKTRPRRPTHNPWLAVKLRNPKYASWRTFLPTASSAN